MLFFMEIQAVAAPNENQLKAGEEKVAQIKVPSKKAIAFRDPFWPVGYVPLALREPARSMKKDAKSSKLGLQKNGGMKPKPVRNEPDWKKALGQLRITGYAETSGMKSCVINDKTVSEGEVVTVDFENFKYSWRVDQIAPVRSQMRFTRQGAVLLKK